MKTEAMKGSAFVRILGPVASRSINTKNGARTIYSQPAELETEAMRVRIDVDVDGPNMGYPVNHTLQWDIAADLIPGRYGPELARRMTLRAVEVQAVGGDRKAG